MHAARRFPATVASNCLVYFLVSPGGRFMTGHQIFQAALILNSLLFIAFPIWAFIRLRTYGILLSALLIWVLELSIIPAKAAYSHGGFWALLLDRMASHGMVHFTHIHCRDRRYHLAGHNDHQCDQEKTCNRQPFSSSCRATIFEQAISSMGAKSISARAHCPGVNNRLYLRPGIRRFWRRLIEFGSMR